MDMNCADVHPTVDALTFDPTLSDSNHPQVQARQQTAAYQFFFRHGVPFRFLTGWCSEKTASQNFSTNKSKFSYFMFYTLIVFLVLVLFPYLLHAHTCIKVKRRQYTDAPLSSLIHVHKIKACNSFSPYLQREKMSIRWQRWAVIWMSVCHLQEK